MTKLTWQEAYKLAVFETDPQMIQVRIEEAERAIRERLDELDGKESDGPERTELMTRMIALSVLAKDSKNW